MNFYITTDKFKTLLAFLALTCITFYANADQLKSTNLQHEIANIETNFGGKIGFAAINTANDTTLEYNGNSRFPICSTHKLIVVAAILEKSMSDPNLLAKVIHFTKKDLVTYSPITKKHLTEGMTISDLCKAAIEISDNTATNLLINEAGGLSAINKFAHSIGIKSFRLDRYEPSLNSASPSDLRDTSTPNDMTMGLQNLIFGNVLAVTQRNMLQDWLKGNTTGNGRIRSGVPKSWIVGDKTGTGGYGTTNDIGVIYPKKCPPIILGIYYTQSKKNARPNNKVIELVTKAILNTFSVKDKCISKA
ncbi:MAG: class A beta-lactamase [bacterium]|nr:class A beta-lactamase [bacterium]